MTPDEARVLGVLIEKATTTPEQYPLSLNAVVNGSNQKNNRAPVLGMDDNQCFRALESLRTRGLVVRVDLAGGRVDKFRHNAGEVLHVRPAELAILAELLLRGPQTLGELRGRASRMCEMESLEVTRQMLELLIQRTEPLARQIAPSPGSRAERYVQLLCPDLHPLDAVATTTPSTAPSSGLAERVEQLESQVDSLRSALRRLAQSLGEADPFAETQG